MLEAARGRLSTDATRRPLPKPRQYGQELDFLGVTPNGDLAVVEVKDGESDYFVPVQLGGYCALWGRVLREVPAVVQGLNELIRQKLALGLLPAGSPAVRSNCDVLPVLVVGNPNYRSLAWRGTRATTPLLQATCDGAIEAGAPLTKWRVLVVRSAEQRLRDVTEELRQGTLR